VLHPIEVLLVLLAIAVGLGILANRTRVPYPILMVCGGLLLSLQPWAPRFSLDPQVVFLFFLPPLLYAAAFDTEWRTFRAHIRPITLLAVGLVLFSTAAVAAVGYYVIGLPLAVAFVLGAIVSPPDAVAAFAVTERIKLPRMITALLEGESLVNDASALVALRVAVGVVAGATVTLYEAGLKFVVISAGGILIGLAGGWLATRLHPWLCRRHLADEKLTITITLLTPFAVYLPAEHLHVSGVLAAVTAGMWVGHRSLVVFEAKTFDQARAVWEWVEFVLNSMIFTLIGFELPVIMEGLTAYSPEQLVRYTLAVCVVVIVSRLLWVFPGAYVPRWFDQVFLGAEVKYPPWQQVVVVGWAGMRGVVSLAAALALPHMVNGRPFEGRHLIQFITFWVIFATLVGQGLTLPLVIRWLGVVKMAEQEEAAERAEENMPGC
jgi:CPA1 family monovalent cation:H+ antiporter